VKLISDPHAITRLVEAEADVVAGKISMAEEMMPVMDQRRQHGMPGPVGH
jgi:hypothetical protein